MAHTSTRRLGLVFLSAVLLTGMLAWRLQASGLMIAMFDDSSSSPVSPVETPTSTSSPAPTPTFTPTPTSTSTPTPTPVPPPIVVSVIPNRGSNDAPSPVTIHGAYFQNSPSVTIGATPLDQITRVDHARLTGVVSAGLAPGAYTIHVCNPDGQCGRLKNAFYVTGNKPVLTRLVPAQGRNNAPNEVAFYGVNLLPGVAITVGTTTLISTTHLSDIEVHGVVPAGLPGGVYDVIARNPDVTDTGILPNAYTVLGPDSDDFFVEEGDIWTDPVTLRQGGPSPVVLGANIHRQGGEVARAVEVRFYLGDRESGGVLLGTISTVPLAPETGDVQPVFINWAPGDLVGAVTLYVEVDPTDEITEINETNNLAYHELVILPPVVDSTPPSILNFSVNEGAQTTTDPTVQVAIEATDDNSGVHSMYLVEQVFNATANMWLAVQNTGWIPFQDAYPFTLADRGGLRYLQVWLADGVGSVTPLPAQARINYLPVRDTILAGQVRVFRFTMASGEQLRTTLETLNTEGDADLYVWGPYREEGRLLRYSDNFNMAEDEVFIEAADSGEYDIEVRGWNPISEYRLSVVLGQAHGTGRGPSAVTARITTKPVPSRPADALTTAPTDRSSIPSAPIAPPKKVYLPLIMLRYQPHPPQKSHLVYLPIIMCDYSAPPAPPHKLLLPLVLR